MDGGRIIAQMLPILFWPRPFADDRLQSSDVPLAPAQVEQGETGEVAGEECAQRPQDALRQGLGAGIGIQGLQRV